MMDASATYYYGMVVQAAQRRGVAGESHDAPMDSGQREQATRPNRLVAALGAATRWRALGVRRAEAAEAS